MPATTCNYNEKWHLVSRGRETQGRSATKSLLIKLCPRDCIVNSSVELSTKSKNGKTTRVKIDHRGSRCSQPVGRPWPPPRLFASTCKDALNNPILLQLRQSKATNIAIMTTKKFILLLTSYCRNDPYSVTEQFNCLPKHLPGKQKHNASMHRRVKDNK
jgi:hypothetical protein